MAARLKWLLVVACIAATAIAVGSPVAQAATKPHAEEGAHNAGDHPHKDGVPLDAEPDLVVWSIVTFVLFVLILRVAAWGPLSAGLNQREAGIQKNIADAESARKKAELMLTEHEKKMAKVQDDIKTMLEEGRRQAETARQSILADAQRDAEATKNRAVADIEQAKNEALNQLFDAMADRVVSATEHVLGRSLNDADQSRLVNEALAQMGNKA